MSYKVYNSYYKKKKSNNEAMIEPLAAKRQKKLIPPKEGPTRLQCKLTLIQWSGTSFHLPKQERPTLQKRI